MRKNKTAFRKPKKQKSKKGLQAAALPTKNELLIRLQHLRSTARDVVNTYLANLESGILKIADELSHAFNEKSKLKTRVLKNLTKMLDNLSLKPEKGRRKDLKKIERAVKRIQGAALDKRN